MDHYRLKWITGFSPPAVKIDKLWDAALRTARDLNG